MLCDKGSYVAYKDGTVIVVGLMWFWVKIELLNEFILQGRFKDNLNVVSSRVGYQTKRPSYEAVNRY